MTKHLGTDFEQHEEQRKPSRVLSWMFDLLFPTFLVAAALLLGSFGWPF